MSTCTPDPLPDRAAPPRRRAVRAGLLLLALALTAAGCGGGDDGPLLVLHHMPAAFERRCDDFSANITGELSAACESARFRLDGGEWRPVAQARPRAPAPQFLIELAPEELRAGANRLEIEAVPRRGEPVLSAHEFTYDPAPVRLPRTVDWGETTDLVVEDGWWERFRDERGQWRVRPVPGTEGYDRVLVICGAFPGGRRLETDVVYRMNLGGKEWGFGILPLWGGRPDDPGHHPKRGWLFSLAWYFGRYKGAGSEFSWRHAREPARFSTSYKSLQLEEDRRYRLVVEVFSEVDAEGRHLRYRQLLKWWADGEPEPAEWIELADTEGYGLPRRDYGVAFVCYRTQVDVGPVVMTPLPARVVAD